jgi:hypothetical protein
MTKIQEYRCKSCKTKIPANTSGVFRVCKCGKMAVDGNDYYTRLIGAPDNIENMTHEKPIYVYRIKHVASGLYFKPSSFRSAGNFSEMGKVYTRKPSLDWVRKDLGTCVIEKYELSQLSTKNSK